MSYCTLTDLQTRYGVRNILAWSDVDNAGATNMTNVAAALAHADAEINVAMTGGGYAIPIVALADYVTSYINDIAVPIAAAWLYSNRGLLDTDPQGAKLFEDRDRALATLVRLKRGSPRLQAQRRWSPNPTGPGCFT
jgi:hypothetical protein